VTASVDAGKPRATVGKAGAQLMKTASNVSRRTMLAATLG
jgi:hypothetical protein